MTIKVEFKSIEKRKPEEDKLFAGNTHLHLRDMTKEEADEYLRQLPVADGLKLLFISYLERHKDDQHYIIPPDRPRIPLSFSLVARRS